MAGKRLDHAEEAVEVGEPSSSRSRTSSTAAASSSSSTSARRPSGGRQRPGQGGGGPAPRDRGDRGRDVTAWTRAAAVAAVSRGGRERGGDRERGPWRGDRDRGATDRAVTPWSRRVAATAAASAPAPGPAAGRATATDRDARTSTGGLRAARRRAAVYPRRRRVPGARPPRPPSPSSRGRRCPTRPAPPCCPPASASSPTRCPRCARSRSGCGSPSARGTSTPSSSAAPTSSSTLLFKGTSPVGPRHRRGARRRRRGDERVHLQGGDLLLRPGARRRPAARLRRARRHARRRPQHPRGRRGRAAGRALRARHPPRHARRPRPLRSSELVLGDHPLALETLGTSSRSPAATATRSTATTSTHYRPENLVVAAAGNVDHDASCALPTELLGDLGRPGGAPAAAHPAGGYGGRGARPHRPTEQAHLVLGGTRARPGRRGPLGAAGADTVLGGGMSSRLFQEIRETAGWPTRPTATLVLHRRRARRRLRRHRAGQGRRGPGRAAPRARPVADDVTDAEVERAKGALTGGTVLGLEDTGSRMSRLGGSWSPARS
jgi:hypothetical protein